LRKEFGNLWMERFSGANVGGNVLEKEVSTI